MIASERRTNPTRLLRSCLHLLGYIGLRFSRWSASFQPLPVVRIGNARRCAELLQLLGGTKSTLHWMRQSGRYALWSSPCRNQWTTQSIIGSMKQWMNESINQSIKHPLNKLLISLVAKVKMFCNGVAFELQMHVLFLRGFHMFSCGTREASYKRYTHNAFSTLTTKTHIQRKYGLTWSYMQATRLFHMLS